MSKNFRAVVSHPSKQGNMYRVPLGAQSCGIRTDFLTGFYYKPDRWHGALLGSLLGADGRRKLERRRQDGLDPRHVLGISGPLPELFYRWFGYQPGNDLHDRLVAAWLRLMVTKGNQGVFHGFQESCRKSLRTARDRGLVTLVEATLPPSAMPIVAAEYRRLNVPWTGPSAPSKEFLVELGLTHYAVAQSRFSVTSLGEYGVAPGRVFMMPLGVDVDKFRPAPKREPRPFRVMFAGQLSVRKGVHHLLEAWRRADLKDAELIFAGGPKDEWIADLLSKAGPSVRRLGFVPHDRFHEAFWQADLFVFPSLAEGGVYVIYEALASGLPCIVSENAGSAVRDGIEGFVLPVGDVDALAASITRLHNDDALRAHMGQAARARGEHFAWPHFYRRIGLMYEEAVRRGGVPANDVFDLFER